MPILPMPVCQSNNAMDFEHPNSPEKINLKIRTLFIAIGVIVTLFALWAIFGSLLTGNKPDTPKGTGAVTAQDTAIVQESDTLKTQ